VTTTPPPPAPPPPPAGPPDGRPPTWVAGPGTPDPVPEAPPAPPPPPPGPPDEHPPAWVAGPGAPEPPAPAPPPAAETGPSDASAARRGPPLPSPFVAIVGYTLRACLPAKRWWGVLLPCLAAIGFGLLTMVPDTTTERAFEIVAELGLFGLVLPLTCLVVGDAVMGADLRAGTFGFTWLSPVSFATIVVGRWLGGWLVALATLVPALVLATLIAGIPDGAAAMAVAGAAGSAAYIGLFVMLGATTRRSAIWSLGVVFLGERLLGGYLAGIAQISPMWESQQVYAGLAEDAGGWRLLREGTPNGWAAVVRLVAITLVTLAIATWRMGHLKPTGGDE
jgi:hypothetical protein